MIRPSQVFSDVIYYTLSELLGKRTRPRIVNALVNLHRSCPLLVHFRISYYLDRYLRILRTCHYDVMVGCWFTGQGKKGDCVGKKVNGGPVFPAILLSSFFFSSFSCRSFPAISKHGSWAGASLVHVFNLIKDVQKRFKTREQEKRELEVGGS